LSYIYFLNKWQHCISFFLLFPFLSNLTFCAIKCIETGKRVLEEHNVQFLNCRDLNLRILPRDANTITLLLNTIILSLSTEWSRVLVGLPPCWFRWLSSMLSDYLVNLDLFHTGSKSAQNGDTEKVTVLSKVLEWETFYLNCLFSCIVLSVHSLFIFFLTFNDSMGNIDVYQLDPSLRRRILGLHCKLRLSSFILFLSV